LKKVEPEERVASYLVLVELASVYSRAGLNRPLELALYSLNLVKAMVISVDFNEVLKRALKLAPQVKLRTLDLLHIAACSLIKAEKFLTLDRDIARKAEEISRVLGIEVMAV